MKNKILYANLKVRFIAHAIDITILSLTTYLLIIMLDTLPQTHSIIFKEFSYLVLSTLYYTILTASSKHASLGKQIMGIIVVDKENQGLSISHSLGRYLAYYFSYITLGIGFLMIAITKKNIGLHDKIAHTYVIHKEK